MKCLEIYLKRVVCIYGTFENNFETSMKVTKYLKESCFVGLQRTLLLQIFIKICCYLKDITKIVPHFGHNGNK